MIPFKWILSYLAKYRIKLVLSMLLVVVVCVLIMVNPYLSGIIVDEVINGGNHSILIGIVAIMIGTTLIRTVMRYIYLISFESVSQRVVGGIREDIYRHVQKMDFNFYDHNRTGDLMARMTGDLDSVRHFTAYIIYSVFENSLMLIFATIMLVRTNALLALVMLGIAPIMTICARRFTKLGKPLFSGVREQYSRLNTVVQENISGNRVVKAFARETYETEKFLKENREYAEKNVKVSMLWSKYLPIMDSVAGLQTAALILVGGLMVIYDPKFTVGDLVMFNSYLWAVNNPIRMAGWMLADVQWFIASADKIMGVLKSKAKVKNPEAPVRVTRLSGAVRFDGVSFGYEKDNYVLKDISIDVLPGQKVGLVGPTGAGKSTIISLMSRFYDAASGGVYLDGRNIQEYDLSDIRRNIAVAMQDIFLFSDTIEGNIVYGVPEAPLEDVLAVAETASARWFVEEMAEGFDTIIGERGVGLSGGQRQRLALARALIKDSPILVLDDTTSAVDMETEAEIQHALKTKFAEQTTFIIAHRISSVKHCDIIYVLEDGRITEQGTHEQLITGNGYYRYVYENQVGGI